MTLNAAENRRFASLDVIRGLAILGILLMNIQSFSMPGAAYLNPSAFGDLSGLNFAAWLFSHLLADNKFMSLFSMLFGASILLISDKQQATGKPPWRLHYSRNFWLLVFGAVHAYLIWYGDILFPYAICGMVVYFFRKRSVRFLLISSIILMSVASGLYLLSGYSMPHWPKESMDEMVQMWSPAEAELQKEIESYRGSFGEQLPNRIESAIELQTFVFLILGFWRISGLMLMGMALYKSGFFTMQKSASQYLKWGLLTGVVGFLLVGVGAWKITQSKWSLEYAMFFGYQWNYWGSVLVAIAYASGIQWMLKRSKTESNAILSKLQHVFSSIGKLALSNYLLQSILATVIFYGFGFGLFGNVNRISQLGFVLVIWSVNIAFSLLWIRRFRYGPFEWLWRSLTRMKFVAIR